MQKKARAKPMVDLVTSVDMSSYSELGVRTPRVMSDKVKTRFMTDTGASISIAGMQYARSLGVREDDLLKSNIEVQSADGSRIDVMGSVLVNIWGVGI